MEIATNHPYHEKSTARLGGRTIHIARILWLFVCVSTTITFLFALPSRFDKLLHPSPANLANMMALGITPLQYARFILSWEILIGASYAFVGFLIFFRSRDESIALLAALMLIVFGLGNGTITPTMRSLLGLNPALDLLQHTFEFLAWLSFGVFFYTFPNGYFVPNWTRWTAAIWLPICIVWNYAGSSPYAPLNWPPVFSVPVIGFFWASFLYSQVYRYRFTSTAVQRQQTKWVVYAISIFIMVMIVTSVIGFFIPGYDLMSEEQPNVQSFAYMFWQWIFSPTAAAVPVAIAFSIFRYRLWDIDRIINRTLVYGLLTAIVIGLYAVLVGGLGYLFKPNNFLLSLLATGLIAVIFQPLRERLQRGVNRLLYGDRDSPIAVLNKLGEQLEAAVAPEATLPMLAKSISQALRLPYVAIMLKEGAEYTLAADCGENSAPFPNCECFPLNYQNETIGQILVSCRAGEEFFNRDEKSLLQNIARQVGVAAYAVQVTRALQHSRERLVTAREEERRRLRRDLHDGIGPTLASQSLTLDAIEKLITNDPDKALSLTRDLKSQTKDSVEEIRHIINDLRPTAVDDLGLLEALHERFARFDQTRLRIILEAPEKIPPLPAAVESAVYRIAVEAVTNVLRHAGASECHICMHINTNLHLEIVDNGVGLPAEQRKGVGLRAMQERAEELGGIFRILPTNQGTHLLIELPLAEAA